jgi:hypothetical protein
MAANRAGYGAAQTWLEEAVARRDRAECWTDWPFARQPRDQRPTVYSPQLKHGIHTARQAFYLANGFFPSEQAGHRCPGGDNRECYNPDHVVDQTSHENVLCAIEDGLNPVIGQKGSANVTAKLTEEQVRWARSMKGQMRQVDIAASLGVKQQVISKIHRGDLWGWLG